MAACVAAASGCGDDGDGGSGSGLPVDESTQLAVDDTGAWVAREGDVVRVGPDLKAGVKLGLAERPTAWASGADGVLWTAHDGVVQSVDSTTGHPKGQPIEVGAPFAGEYTDQLVVGGDVVWVSSNEYVSGIDVRTGKLIGPHVRATDFVGDLVADEDAAYFSASPSAAEGSNTTVTRIDARTGDTRIVQPEPERGIFFAQLAVGAGQVWVTQSRTAAERGKTYTQDTGTVTPYDAKTLEQRGRPTPISPDPHHIVVTPDTAWITDDSGDIAVVDTRTGARRPSPAPLAEPAIAAGDARTVYLWERGGKLHAFDQKSSAPVGDVRDVNEVPGEVVLTGASIWLLDEPTQDPESDDEPPWSVTRLDR